MSLWLTWWKIIWQLRPASSRLTNFLWFATAVAGFTIRSDLAGVTSVIRALGLDGKYYDNLLDFFHSDGLKLDKLTVLWTKLVLKIHPGIARCHGRLLLCGDGIKAAKEGRKMPGVKLLHQESDSNTKAEYIMGHSCQAVAILVQGLMSFFALPLACRIHEGVVFSNFDKRTLLDKMILLINSLGITEPFYFIADAYYATRSMINGLILDGNHLITRVKKNAVAYLPIVETSETKGRGRPKKYGDKVKLRDMLDKKEGKKKAKSPVYGETDQQILYTHLDLLWKPVGILVRFVFVIHPKRGKAIFMTTDLSLDALEVIRLYGLRFKIEVAFKQALRVLGTFAYHFWMRAMDPIKRFSGKQYLHKKSAKYRNDVKRKIAAYHRAIQIGLIAQGLLQILSSVYPKQVWSSFGSWIRTIRPNICPSEQVTAQAMRNTLPEFLVDSKQSSNLTKFILDRIDFSRSEGLRLAG